MHEITCAKTFNITDEDIDDIMADALDSGIGYWCGEVEVVGDYLGEYASDQISRGGTLVFHDAEDPEDVHAMDLESFLKGYRMSIELGYFSGDLDNEYDAETADVIVQLALFDDVIYR